MAQVKSADRVMHILLLCSRYPQGLKEHDICELLSLPKSSTHQLLVSMLEENFLELQGKHYKLGSRLLTLTQAYQHDYLTLSAIDNCLKLLNVATNLTCQIAVLKDYYVEYVAKVKRKSNVPVSTAPGLRQLAHNTALGKVLLSAMTDDFLELKYSKYRFKKVTVNSISNYNDLMQELIIVRKNKFAYDKEESTLGLFCIAIELPLKIEKNPVALSVSLSSSRFENCDPHKIVKQLKIAGRTLGDDLKINGS